MGRDLYKLTKIFNDVIVMLFYDVIKMRQLKKVGFRLFFAEYLKNGSTGFNQIYVIFRQSSIVSSEIKRLKTGHS